MPLSPLHRLDRFVSGTLLFASAPHTAGAISAELRERSCRKIYVARCKGGSSLPLNATTRIDKPLVIGKLRNGGVRVATPRDSDGVFEASTLLRPVAYDRETDTSLVLLSPLTGRTHQLRVHAASMGAPPRHPVRQSGLRD